MTDGVVNRWSRPGLIGPRFRWLLALAALGGVLFSVGFVVRVRCSTGGCPSAGVRQLLDLDSVGGLPRLFTTGLFVGVTLLAAAIAARAEGGGRVWWCLVALGAVVLAGAKLLSTHSSAERMDGPWLTLLVGSTVSVVVLSVLWSLGRRWSVPAAGSVTVALALYSAAALGLDQVTALVRAFWPGPVAMAFATFVEESGEALAAWLVLAAVTAFLPRRRVGGGSGGALLRFLRRRLTQETRCALDPMRRTPSAIIDTSHPASTNTSPWWRPWSLVTVTIVGPSSR